jgi:hypothetical protein
MRLPRLLTSDNSAEHEGVSVDPGLFERYALAAVDP